MSNFEIGALGGESLSSENWSTIERSFRRGATAFEVLGKAAQAGSLKTPDPVKAGRLAGMALAAEATAWIAEQAADAAAELARVAKEQEEAKRKSEEVEQQRRADQERRNHDFEEHLEKSYREYRADWESGRFIKEYRDKPSREQVERTGSLA